MNRRKFIQNAILAGFGVTVGLPVLSDDSFNPSEFAPVASLPNLKVSGRQTFTGVDISPGGFYTVVTLEKTEDGRYNMIDAQHYEFDIEMGSWHIVNG